MNFDSHHSSASKRAVVRTPVDRVVSHIDVEDSKERGMEGEKVIETLVAVKQVPSKLHPGCGEEEVEKIAGG